MITKKKLDRYPKILRSINYVKLELQDMLTSDSGIGTSVIMNYNTGYGVPETISGFDMQRYKKNMEILNKLKLEEREVREFIEGIEDPETNYVFKLKYFEGKTWSKISIKIGYGGNADYPRLHIRDKYLKSIGIIKKTSE